MENNDELIDSQLLAENVGFLENCFDQSFDIQSSILLVKKYAAEVLNDTKSPKIRKSEVNLTNRTFNTSICNTSQINKPVNIAKVVDKTLEAWGLPEEIVNKYKSRGITEMFDWQVECLSNSKVLLDCCNLVYSAPTSAGKTLVAEILTVKTVMERLKKAIIILPFVSIVREKMFYLQDILSSSGIRVEGFMGSQTPAGGFQSVHVAICTIEKANSLVNRMLDDGTISELGAVIVDELHLLGDPHRGYLLELLLTKIKYAASKSEDTQIQIIGMSATLPNLEVLAKWLDAELFITQFRPIPLEEYCLVGQKYFDKHGSHVKSVDTSIDTIIGTDSVLQICFETIKDGCSVLIFCMTKNRCESLAQTIASTFYKLGSSMNDAGSILRKQLKTDSILEVLEQLRSSPVGLDQVLKSTVSFGVAYHHAGLAFDERDIIEGGFKSGAIRVLVATSTLSSGVNLPARKVIIRSPVFQRQSINILSYKQMAGRAGRMGKDTHGESILICTEAEKKIGFNLMMGDLEPVKSCIEIGDKFMRAILEMIASDVAGTMTQLRMYSDCTLLFVQQSDTELHRETLLQDTLDELISYELIRVQNDKNFKKYSATSLGKACLSSSMAPNDGLSLFCELQRARQCLVLETDLHLLYLVTPYSVSSQWANLDWLHLLTMWESLTKAMKRVGELVGIEESFIICCLRGNNKFGSLQKKMDIHKRFYTALALFDLVNEVPLSEVAEKFQCARGFLQGLQQASATFAGMVTIFCHQLGWKNMEMLISQFQDRLHFGIHSELLELMKLPSLNGLRARSLFNAGFETLSSIASSNTNDIENALVKALPFQSEKQRDGEFDNDIRKRNKLKNVWITGCCGMTTEEAAENLILEARQYLQRELGVDGIKWASNKVHDLKKGHDTSMVPSNSSIIVIEQSYSKENVNLQNITEIPCNRNPEMIRESHNSPQSNVRTSKNIVDVGDPVVMEDSEKKLQIQTVQSPKNENSMSHSIDLKKDEILWDSEPLLTCMVNQSAKTTAMKHIQITKHSEQAIIRESEQWNLKKDNSLLNLQNRLTHLIDLTNNQDLREQLVSKKDVCKQKKLLRTSKTEDSPNITTNTQSSETVQEEIIWDSLNINDTALNNVIKLRISEKLFSPDLSFGESSNIVNQSKAESIANSAVNDISLFSSDADCNTSLFEDSLPIDQIPSKLLEATKGSQHDSEDDMKLVYDESEETKSATESIKKNNTINLSTLKRKIKNKESMISNKKIKFEFPQINFKYSEVYSLFGCSGFALQCDDIFSNFDLLRNPNTFLSIYIADEKTKYIGQNIHRKKIPNGIAFYTGAKYALYFDLPSLKLQDRKLLRSLLSSWLTAKGLNIKCYSLKTTCQFMKQFLDIEIPLVFSDIGISEWLIENVEKVTPLEAMTDKYCNELIPNQKDDLYLQMFKKTVAIYRIAEKQQVKLNKIFPEASLSVLETECHVARILLHSCSGGLAVERRLAARLMRDVRCSLDRLQKKANALAGHPLNIASTKAVAKVLGLGGYGRKVSTKKSVLQRHSSPIASIIMYWRKLNSILTKTIFPLNETLMKAGEARIYPSYTTFTCTGRVSMHEPNLQNIPRTFSVPLALLSYDVTGDVMEFNFRSIVVASAGHVLLSADYCQLEMRILTHFSEDDVLTRIMQSDVDVFKSIAAAWNGVSEVEVNDDLRQITKQLCYGIIYGMSCGTLAQSLAVSELEAKQFMDDFLRTYPSVDGLRKRIVLRCSETGYVETLMKRRRHLDDICSTNLAKKRAAERQAVNTTIQGSAADIAKAAMCTIDRAISQSACEQKPRLILQMHDELIYEVPETNKDWFVGVIRRAMEHTVQLKVPLPVKVKTGLSWGSLEEI